MTKDKTQEDHLSRPGNVTIIDDIRHIGESTSASWRTAMARSLNLSLTNELRAFLDENSGDGTLFSTPSEFVRDLIRRRKEEQDAAAMRESVLEGYADVRDGRTQEFTGDLPAMLEARRTRRDGG